MNLSLWSEVYRVCNYLMTQCDCKLMTLSVAVLLPGCLAWLCTSLWPREHGGSGQWPERPVTHSPE